MPAAVASRKPPASLIVVVALVLLGLAAALIYLNKPVTKEAGSVAPTAEAKAYLRNLALTDEAMQATENFMNQRVVEMLGNITNNGPRKLASIDVYCLFSGVNGAVIHRERVPIVKSGGGVAPLGPGETRPFRLPFDDLPEGWNQAMPHLVIAQITFAE
jgi:hypothetical protein